MTADDRRTEPPHPDLDTIADLHAGALDDPEGARVRTHVDGCPRCAEILAALDRVRAELHALPAPALPPAVVARLDATLATLGTDHPTPADATRGGTRVGTHAGTAAAPPRADGTDRAPASTRPEAPPKERAQDELAAARLRRSRRLSRAITSVAAAVVVIAAGASITAIVRSGGSDNSTSSAAGGGADSAASSARGSGLAPNQRSDSGPGLASEPRQAVPRYDRASLSAALPQIARQYRLPAAGSPVPVGAGAMADPARRTACAATIPHPAGPLRAVAQITYQNQPAYVFVSDDGGSLTGYVVSDQCGTPAALTGTVLDTVR